MKMTDSIPEKLLAPCGINCLACYAHLRKKKPCPGCREEEDAKPAYCQRCKLSNCVIEQGIDFCFQCTAFPCKLVKQIDKRYRTSYQVNLIGDALRLKSAGAVHYLAAEKERWGCPECGGVVSMHTRLCSECGEETSRQTLL